MVGDGVGAIGVIVNEAEVVFVPGCFFGALPEGVETGWQGAWRDRCVVFVVFDGGFRGCGDEGASGCEPGGLVQAEDGGVSFGCVLGKERSGSPDLCFNTSSCNLILNSIKW